MGYEVSKRGIAIRWIFASKYSKEIICILYLVDIKPTNHESCFPNFFSVSGDENENKLFIGPKLRKNCFGPMKSLSSFSTVQAEKDLWKIGGN